MRLRRASSEDGDLLLSWRNEWNTRRWAFNTDEVAPAEHDSWFRDRLADPCCVIWIAESGDRAVGQVRLEKVDEATAAVDVSVADDLRGRGIGTQMLREASMLAGTTLGIRRLVAQIKPGNTASMEVFRRAGFSLTSRGTVVEMERAL